LFQGVCLFPDISKSELDAAREPLNPSGRVMEKTDSATSSSHAAGNEEKRGPETMKHFHARVSVTGRESWRKLKTLHGFLTAASGIVKVALSKDEADYEDRMEDTLEAFNGDASQFGKFYTPEAPLAVCIAPCRGRRESQP